MTSMRSIISFIFFFAIFNICDVSCQDLNLPQQVGSPVPQIPQNGPSELCIGCICEAASLCNRTLGCTNGMCGLFKITKPYWIDAGKPLIDGDNPADEQAWERCAIDPFCAGQTVLDYTTRFSKDCNSDGRIDCRDFAMIHHLGGYGCGTRPLEVLYERQLNGCLVAIQE